MQFDTNQTSVKDNLNLPIHLPYTEYVDLVLAVSGSTTRSEFALLAHDGKILAHFESFGFHFRLWKEDTFESAWNSAFLGFKNLLGIKPLELYSRINAIFLSCSGLDDTLDLQSVDNIIRSVATLENLKLENIFRATLAESSFSGYFNKNEIGGVLRSGYGCSFHAQHGTLSTYSYSSWTSPFFTKGSFFSLSKDVLDVLHRVYFQMGTADDLLFAEEFLNIFHGEYTSEELDRELPLKKSIGFIFDELRSDIIHFSKVRLRMFESITSSLFKLDALPNDSVTTNRIIDKYLAELREIISASSRVLQLQEKDNFKLVIEGRILSLNDEIHARIVNSIKLEHKNLTPLDLTNLKNSRLVGLIRIAGERLTSKGGVPPNFLNQFEHDVSQRRETPDSSGFWWAETKAHT